MLLLALAPEHVHARQSAAPPDARAEARTLAAEGSDAFEAGDFERALALFNRAAELVEAPTIALMQARTLVELGRLAAALERYAAAQRMEPSDSGNAAFQSAAAAAERELALLKPRIPTLRVKLVGAQAKGARVAIDGRTLPPGSVGFEHPLDPGAHNVEVKTAEGNASGRSITLVEGAREELVFSLEPVVRVTTTERSEPAPAPALTPAREDFERPSRVGGWVVLGSGIGFAGAGATLGVLALANKAELDEACQPGCPEDKEDDMHAFRLQRTLSYVGFTLGAVGIGAGVYLLVRSGPGETSTALTFSPSGVKLSGRFH